LALQLRAKQKRREERFGSAAESLESKGAALQEGEPVLENWPSTPGSPKRLAVVSKQTSMALNTLGVTGKSPGTGERRIQNPLRGSLAAAAAVARPVARSTSVNKQQRTMQLELRGLRSSKGESRSPSSRRSVSFSLDRSRARAVDSSVAENVRDEETGRGTGQELDRGRGLGRGEGGDPSVPAPSPPPPPPESPSASKSSPASRRRAPKRIEIKYEYPAGVQ
jgi:hypothetical protein